MTLNPQTFLGGPPPSMKKWINEHLDLTAKSYVQNGLLAMWDGIENAGFGVHDPDATYWVDLVRPDQRFKLSTDSNVGAWAEDHFVLSGDFCHFYPTWGANEYFSDISAQGFQFEVNIRIPEVKQINGYGDLVAWRSSEHGPIDIASPWNLLRITGGYTGVGHNDSDSYDLRGYIGSEFKGVLSLAAGVNGLYLNGEMVRPQFTSRYGISPAHVFLLNRGGQDRTDFYNVRIYNRTLRPHEVYYNYMVDKVRFGL